MGCTHSNLSFVDGPLSSSMLTDAPAMTTTSAHFTVIAGTRRAGVCWCGNFCRGMLDPGGNPCRQRCCLHSARPWTSTSRQCDACHFRQKEARSQKVRHQQDAMKRQIHVSNGIYLNKNCCGRPCQIISCPLCCEHMKPPSQLRDYCSMCQERVSASPPGEGEDVCDTKDTESDGKGKVEEEDLFPTVVEDECPICLEHLPMDELCRLPCGHCMCHSHIDKLDRCPLCRNTVPGAAVMLMSISAWKKRHGRGDMQNEPIE